MTTEARITKAIVDQTGVHPTAVSAGLGFYADLDCDDLDKIAIICAVESDFAIVISDDEAEQVQTVGDLIALVDLKTKVLA